MHFKLHSFTDNDSLPPSLGIDYSRQSADAASSRLPTAVAIFSGFSRNWTSCLLSRMTQLTTDKSCDENVTKLAKTEQ